MGKKKVKDELNGARDRFLKVLKIQERWAKDYADMVVAKDEAIRVRNSLTQRLSARYRVQKRAIELLAYAVHLRTHGERAPGGRETWAKFDQMAEQFLRFHSPAAEAEEARLLPASTGDEKSQLNTGFFRPAPSVSPWVEAKFLPPVQAQAGVHYAAYVGPNGKPVLTWITSGGFVFPQDCIVTSLRLFTAPAGA